MNYDEVKQRVRQLAEQLPTAEYHETWYIGGGWQHDQSDVCVMQTEDGEVTIAAAEQKGYLEFTFGEHGHAVIPADAEVDVRRNGQTIVGFTFDGCEVALIEPWSDDL